MISHLKHSQQLSKRFKKDDEFRSVLFPGFKTFNEVEDGIKEIKYLDDNESFLSEVSCPEIDEDIAKQVIGSGNNELLAWQKNVKMVQSLMSKKRLKKCKQNNKALFLKTFDLKRNPSPIINFRFLNYILYFDSDMFSDHNDISNKEFRSMHDIYDHKRAGSVIYDKNKKCFKIKMQEKDLDDKQTHQISPQLNYYISWLQSMGNCKAINLIEILTKFKERNEDTIKKLIQNSVISYDVMSQANNRVFFIQTIDEKTKKYILEQPYLTRTSKIDLTNISTKPGLIEEEYNMDYVKLMGYHEESDMDELMTKFLGLDIQKSTYVKSSYNNILDFSQRLMKNFDFKDDSTKTTCYSFQEKFIMRDKNGEDGFKLQVDLYEERWYEDSSLYIKSYVTHLKV